ncbi:DUF190 domain-containing protein [Paludisphaera soli]|uniref:DUF190 domain-containing protein n=1 Tax=Paludisphaera soli TaxID=2712865 RepID=UPI0013EE390D|nr:DUF190 domain-containing protein [Paludisphaera soli]
MIPTDAALLRLYLNASLRWRGQAVYRAVVGAARSLKLAGASVFLVDMSYGARNLLRDSRSEYLGVDVPVVIEIVDVPDRLGVLLDELEGLGPDGLVTLEPVRVVSRAGAPPARIGSSTPDRGGPTMRLEESARRVTVYIGSSDLWRGVHLASAIVQRCRELGVAGATASLGVMGFGRHSVIHRTHLLGLSEDVPEKVEIVDRPDRIDALLPVLEEMVDGGLILVEDVRVVRRAQHADRAVKGTPA